MNKNYTYFLQTNMDEYIGKWVAIDDNRVIASGTDVEKVHSEAKRINPKGRPLIAKVPEKIAMIF